MGTATLLIGILTRNILKPLPEVSTISSSKVMAQIVVFVFSVTLTFELCSIFFDTRIVHDVLEYGM